MQITKLLSPDSMPAGPILERAASIALTYAQRFNLPKVFNIDGVEVQNGLGEVRPLEVGDILVDEKGGFYKVVAASETIYEVSGDIDLMREAVYAFSARGLRVAQTDEGFAVVGGPQFKQMLEAVGLTVTEKEAPFEPVPLPCPSHGSCGCGCGGHHHHDHGECSCGGHHHEHGECCCSEHEHKEDECCCGGHDHKKGECCCSQK